MYLIEQSSNARIVFFEISNDIVFKLSTYECHLFVGLKNSTTVDYNVSSFQIISCFALDTIRYEECNTTWVLLHVWREYLCSIEISHQLDLKQTQRVWNFVILTCDDCQTVSESISIKTDFSQSLSNHQQSSLHKNLRYEENHTPFVCLTV